MKVSVLVVLKIEVSIAITVIQNISEHVKLRKTGSIKKV